MARIPQDPQIRIDEILDTAEPLFLANGYRKTTILDITKKMGVAKGMVYYYFKSKEEILEGLVNRRFSVLLADITQMAYSNDFTPPRKIELILNAIIHSAQEKDGLLLDILSDEQNIHIKNKMVRQAALVLNPSLLKIIEEGTQKEWFHPSQPDIAVNFILSTLRCITDAMSDKASGEQMACYLKTAESLIATVLAMPDNALCLSLEQKQFHLNSVG
ncbi:TetR/AcrR family transcriptional regulator [Acetonema longum]|uniref:TetR family transcriptional regulator n=1 Tax=Acetonema longum DSM 6540 TaxID=1009370 RepID=F7NFR2_9FIRM|nr:TetR/AcrR family transcriptional regulator [Acetonema longum]EGO65125.1 TetR family transcriptional regulator [Acetonema longum DSM 6540]